MTRPARGLPVAAIAGALFCLVLIYLALQLRAGADPAIGAGHQAAAKPARQVIVRRVILRRIVEIGPAPVASGGGGGGGGAGVAGPAAVGAPAAPTAAPVAAAPAPAAAPAAAPVVSGGS